MSQQLPSTYILKGSDDGVPHSGLLDFGVLSIVWYSKRTLNSRDIDISNNRNIDASKDFTYRCIDQSISSDINPVDISIIRHNDTVYTVPFEHIKSFDISMARDIDMSIGRCINQTIYRSFVQWRHLSPFIWEWKQTLFRKRFVPLCFRNTRQWTKSKNRAILNSQTHYYIYPRQWAGAFFVGKWWYVTTLLFVSHAVQLLFIMIQTRQRF
jgi:hypothetical protein